MSDGQLALNTNLVSPGLFFKDSNGDSVKIGPVHVGTTAPNATPGAGGQAGNSKGEAWLDTTAANPILKVWNGSAFVAVQPVGTGTVVSTTDSGTVTSTMILDGTIVNADINASAEIAVSKLQDGEARQLLQTDAAGTGVEWASNIDIPGTLDVTGATVFDSTVVVNTTGALTLPDGTTAQRPASPATGDIRFNTTVVQFEGYDGAAWGTIGGDSSLAGTNNAIINGSFALAQRGTSFVAGANNDDSYNLDRWYVLSDGNDIVDITQDTATVPTNGKYAIALDVETVNKKFGIAQIIEADSCIGLIGDQVTLSFKARVSSTTNLDNVKAAIVAWSGTADTVTSDIISAWGAEGTNPTLIANATYENTPVNLNLTTSYATYSVTATVDTASTKNIVVFIWSDVTTTSPDEFLYITDVQLEVGPVATPFERRPIGTELALCQRYFCKSYNQSVNPGAITTAGELRLKTFGGGNSSSSVEVFYPVVMRGAPSITSFSPGTGTSGKCRRDNVDQDASAQSIGDYKAVINSSVVSTDNEMRAHFTASAEL